MTDDAADLLTAYRLEGFGKGHAAPEGHNRALCGALVKGPRLPLALPFRPEEAPSRCGTCVRLAKRRQSADDSRTTAEPVDGAGFTE